MHLVWFSSWSCAWSPTLSRRRTCRHPSMCSSIGASAIDMTSTTGLRPYRYRSSIHFFEVHCIFAEILLSNSSLVARPLQPPSSCCSQICSCQTPVNFNFATRNRHPFHSSDFQPYPDCPYFTENYQPLRLQGYPDLLDSYVLLIWTEEIFDLFYYDW